MSVVQVRNRTVRHKAKEIAAGESPEPRHESAPPGYLKNIRNVPYTTRWIIHKQCSSGYEKIWYINSKGHFEFVSRYEQLTSERNEWIGKVKQRTMMEAEPEIEKRKENQSP